MSKQNTRWEENGAEHWMQAGPVHVTLDFDLDTAFFEFSTGEKVEVQVTHALPAELLENPAGRSIVKEAHAWAEAQVGQYLAWVADGEVPQAAPVEATDSLYNQVCKRLGEVLINEIDYDGPSDTFHAGAIWAIRQLKYPEQYGYDVDTEAA
jgi:hypothetical protein